MKRVLDNHTYKLAKDELGQHIELTTNDENLFLDGVTSSAAQYYWYSRFVDLRVILFMTYIRSIANSTLVSTPFYVLGVLASAEFNPLYWEKPLRIFLGIIWLICVFIAFILPFTSLRKSKDETTEI